VLVPIDPSTIEEWRTAMLEILAAPIARPELAILADGRQVETVTTELVGQMSGFFSQHQNALAHSRTALVVNDEAAFGMGNVSRAWPLTAPSAGAAGADSAHLSVNSRLGSTATIAAQQEVLVRPKPAAASICLSLCLLIHAACNRSAIRVEPISGILDAFRSHQIVALGEGLHGNSQAHAFRLALIREPRFASIVNDLVVEFGSGRYQTVMDAFISGADVPYAQLRKAWQDTTNPTPIWDSPIYEEFFRAVRDVNASLPRERKLRVVLGEPPIDWNTVRAYGEVAQWISRRTTHAVDVIKSEVLAKNHRAIVIYGDSHFRRYSKWAGSSATELAHPTLLNRIEAQGTRAFSIWTNTTVELERLQPDIVSWPIPSLTRVRGTRLGRLDFKYFAGKATDPPTTMEDQFDAVLYLGPVSSITQSVLSPSLCADAEYTKMRLARMTLEPAGPAAANIDIFKKECGSYLGQQQK